ncbi:MAG TPA: TlpA disulfide reductase family protein [Pirellulales bacterium]|jgi:thiol-disulfide isomerase/thioredoxin|nr:TlpA disulfide reductase family protein [Pirellulales bacterium]
MIRKRKTMAWGFLLVLTIGAVAVRADDQAAKEPAAKDTVAAKDRDEKAILAELSATKEKLDAVMPSISSITDADFRKQDGPKVRPLLQQTADLLKELAAAQKDADERQGLEDDRCQYLAMLATLGDDAATAILEKTAAGGSNALAAKAALVLSKWWLGSKNAEAQEKILTDFTAVAKANPASEKVALTLAVMASVGPANDDVAMEAVAVLRKVMTSEKAKQLATELDPNGAQRELIGKPLAAAGRTSTGKTLTSADWKGKVVLIDFWATWCGPCNAEIPRIKELYKTYHSKGFEIVGLDCDSDDDTVNTFIKDKDMTWPQLREESQTEKEPWHPLAAQWGVGGIPTMFLVDKKGVLRFIDAREDTAAKIDKLLAE